MYKNIVSLIDTQNVFTLCISTIFILTACFIIGCEEGSSSRFSTRLLEAFDEGFLDLNRTITVTLDEKDGSGITGTATFTEYVGSASKATIRNFDVEIQNAVSGRKYAAYIYSGSSCDAPGSIWDVEGFASYSFTADEQGVGISSYLVDLTIDTNPSTDILGKVLVIHEHVGDGDLADGTQVSCGVITLTE